MSRGPGRVDPDDNDQIMATVLESVEDIRRAAKPAQVPTAREPQQIGETIAFRPTRRPPVALLTILDDEGEEGETIRLRGDKVVIGRSEGDIVIPHDTMMSGRHAELCREEKNGRYLWHLIDLRSTNGSYVRVERSVLKDGQELLIGGARYRFDGIPESDGPGRPADRGAREQFPSLVELLPAGEGQRHSLKKQDNWIGRDPRHCAVLLSNDLLVSPLHARIGLDPRGRWQLENNRSLNGTWLRIHRLAVGPAGQFQLGEQRFVLKTP